MPIIEVKGHEGFLEINKPDEYIIFFKADWCLPSRAMYKIVSDSSSKNKDIVYYVFDIERHDFTHEIKEYRVFTLPTSIYINKGTLRGTSVGTLTRAQFATFAGLDKS